MSALSPEGQAVVDDAAARHGFSPDAVTHVLMALDQGGGGSAQFNHNELGGMGQWSMGGMTMIGDMFNNALKARVDALCSDLSNAMAQTRVFRPQVGQAQSHSFQSQSQGGNQQQMQGGGLSDSSLFVAGSGSGNWWPEELGQPGSTGAQNTMKYACFPQGARLAILLNGNVTVYDTGAHHIQGFGQQQGGDQSLTFTSQFGLVRVSDLPVVAIDATERPTATQPEVSHRPAPPDRSEPADQPEPSDFPDLQQATELPPAPPNTAPAATAAIGTASAGAPSADPTAILETLEKLASLRDKGILSEAEFSDKKAELLARL